MKSVINVRTKRYPYNPTLPDNSWTKFIRRKPKAKPKAAPRQSGPFVQTVFPRSDPRFGLPWRTFFTDDQIRATINSRQLIQLPLPSDAGAGGNFIVRVETMGIKMGIRPLWKKQRAEETAESDRKAA